MEGKDELTGRMLLETQPEETLDAIEATAMDLSLSYEGAEQAIISQADVVHDRYHISANLNDAVDQVRRSQNKSTVEEGDDTLKGTRQLWLSSPHNHSSPEPSASIARSLFNLAHCKKKPRLLYEAGAL